MALDSKNKYLIVFLEALGLVCLVSIILSSMAINTVHSPTKIRMCHLQPASNTTDFWEVKMEFVKGKISYYVRSDSERNVTQFSILGPYNPYNGLNVSAPFVRISRSSNFITSFDKPHEGYITSEYIDGKAIHPVMFNKKTDDIIDFTTRYYVFMNYGSNNVTLQVQDSC